MASVPDHLRATPSAVDDSEQILTAQDILVADDIEYTKIPGFKPGQVFRIKSLTAGDLIEWSEANSGEAKRTAGLRLIIKSLVDGEGKLIMSDRHIEMLKLKTHKVTERIVKEILHHNGMNVKQDKDAKND